MKKILATLGATAVLSAALMATPPAEAITCPPIGSCFGGTVKHGSDDGYDQPILVVCNWGDAFYSNGNPRPWSQLAANSKLVAEGGSSKSVCGTDTDVIVVRDNEELWCLVGQPGNTYYGKVFDATGPHKISDVWNDTCVLHRD